MEILKPYLNALAYEELMTLRRELDAGAPLLKQVVKQRIVEERKKHDAKCAICQSAIEPESHSSFTIIFGPEDFRKKASFCAQDCLEYFLKQMRDRHERG